MRLAGARLLDERDSTAVRAALIEAPVMSCMVSARVESAGIDPWRLGGELWGVDARPIRGGRVAGLCFSGPNLVPLYGNASALRCFADRALRRRRVCSSLVGPAEQVLGLWDELESDWGPPREIRADQPLMATDVESAVSPDPLVRPVRINELDDYLPAAIAMFMEEVGIDPCLGDGGTGYRARVAELIGGGRAFARFESGQVVFKAEIGALSSRVGQIQGVWVHPERRGAGLGVAGTAAVVNHLVRTMNRTASLYVNAFNAPALAAYHRIGFQQVGQFATVLF
ncbi:MAG: GNAT family N-acetyltransferase [Pseudonocardiaceae bacterium]|nr:GNAT family N-acetyltransferase [Pseudonocardiaceae bacterium]